MGGDLAYASEIALFPATPYLEELIGLQNKAKPGRDSLAPEPEALSTRMVAQADEKGRFQFSKMKPGRYYLTTRIAAVFGGTRDVQVGRVEDGYGGANVYAKQDYTFDAESTIGKFVTVQQDGETVSVTLQPPVSAIRSSEACVGRSWDAAGCADRRQVIRIENGATAASS